MGCDFWYMEVVCLSFFHELKKCFSSIWFFLKIYGFVRSRPWLFKTRFDKDLTVFHVQCIKTDLTIDVLHKHHDESRKLLNNGEKSQSTVFWI